MLIGADGLNQRQVVPVHRQNQVERLKVSIADLRRTQGGKVITPQRRILL
jgi:hypothetical protein